MTKLIKLIKESDNLQEIETISTIEKILQRDENGRNALHWVAFLGKIEILEIFIKLKKINDMTGGKIFLNFDIQDKYGHTPLHIAIFSNHTNIAQILISNNANYYIKDKNGRTPLIFAKKKGNEEIIRILTKNDANQNIKNNLNDTYFDNNSAKIVNKRKKTSENIIFDQSPINSPLPSSRFKKLKFSETKNINNAR